MGKTNYILADFAATVQSRFPERAQELRMAVDKRMKQLRQLYGGATKGMRFHLENQIIPGIAVYETLCRVMPREEAVAVFHGYVEKRAWREKKLFLRLMQLPGLYRRVPGLFTKYTRRLFGERAGFSFTEIDTSKGAWRIDMTRCPYHDACVRCGCPELCHCFCDSDDITYDHLHKRLYWHRTKTLGRGDDCCDFCLRIREEEK